MKVFIRIAVLLGLLVSTSISAGSGPRAASADRPTPRQVADQLRQQAKGQLDIDWDDDTGVPSFVVGDIPIDVSASRADRSPE